MSPTVSHRCWLSFTVPIKLPHVSHCLPWLLAVPHCLSGPMELLHISHCCWLSLTVSPSAMVMLAVSNCLPWLLTFSHCIYGPMELLHVSHCIRIYITLSPSAMELPTDSHCFPWLLDVSQMSLWSLGVAMCLSLVLAISYYLTHFHGVAAGL